MRKSWIVLLLLFLSASIGYAQSDITAEEEASAFKEQQRVLQEFQNRLKSEATLRDQHQQDQRPKQTSSTLLPEKEKKQGQLPSFDISTIVFKGATTLDRMDRYQLTHRWINTTMDLNDINQLIRETTNLYISKGYVTSRAVIPQQNLTNGTLIVQVIEGKIETIRFKGNHPPLWIPFSTGKGRLLNMRDIEQGLDQLNRLNAYNVTSAFIPGKEMGDSIIELKTTSGNAYTISMGYDTSSSRLFGAYPHRFDFSRDNFLGIYDNWYVNYSQDLGDAGSNNKSSAITMTVPFGYSLFTVNFSAFDYRSLITGSNTTFESSGGSTNWTTTLAHTLLRTSGSKTSLSGSLNYKDTESFIEDVKSDTGSRTLIISSIGLTQSFTTQLGTLGLTGTYHEGLGVGDASRDDSSIINTDPHAQFVKYTGDLSYSNSFKLLGIPLSFSSNLHGHYAPKATFSSEQISIGGNYTVRGYDGTSLQGDYGHYMRSQLTFSPASLAAQPYFQKLFTGASLYAAFDSGHVRSKDRSVDGTMSGATIGLNYYGSPTSYTLSYSLPVYHPGTTEDDSLFRFTVTFKLL
jgi:hemolysin activation/secretion protein